MGAINELVPVALEVVLPPLSAVVFVSVESVDVELLSVAVVGVAVPVAEVVLDGVEVLLVEPFCMQED
jgi:hypothetical protein